MQSGIVEKFVRGGIHNVVPGNQGGRSGGVVHGSVPHAPGGAAPTIEVIREGDVVQAIDVTCTCGETFRLWCSYESDGPSSVEA